MKPSTKARFGRANGNWKGGVCKHPSGNTRVLVGKGHRLADANGYAPLHRVNADRRLKRRGKKLRARDVVDPATGRVFPSRGAYMKWRQAR